jgi:hypothetical protein
LLVWNQSHYLELELTQSHYLEPKWIQKQVCPDRKQELIQNQFHLLMAPMQYQKDRQGLELALVPRQRLVY